MMTRFAYTAPHLISRRDNLYPYFFFDSPTRDLSPPPFDPRPFPCLALCFLSLCNTAFASASWPWLTNHLRARPCRSLSVGLPATIIHIANSGSAGVSASHWFSAIRKSCTRLTFSVRSTASSRWRKLAYSVMSLFLPIHAAPPEELPQL